MVLAEPELDEENGDDYYPNEDMDEVEQEVVPTDDKLSFANHC